MESESSAVVRVRDGAPVVTDGPYLEAKEYLGGYYLVECETGWPGTTGPPHDQPA